MYQKEKLYPNDDRSKKVSPSKDETQKGVVIDGRKIPICKESLRDNHQYQLNRSWSIFFHSTLESISLTTCIRKAKTLYIFNSPLNMLIYCVVCNRPLENGQKVVAKARYTGRIPQTVHRECYVDARGIPIFGENDI